MTQLFPGQALTALDPISRAPPPRRAPAAGAPLLLRRFLPALALLAFLASPRAARAEPGDPGADDNPRNGRRAAPLLPWLRPDAQAPVPERGQRRSFPEGTVVRWSVAPDPGGAGVAFPAVRFSLDRRPRAPVRDGGPADATGGSVRWSATQRREELSAEIDGDRCVVATDALVVALLVERDTLRAGDRRFGSLVRRVRASLDALNDLLAASVHPHAPRGVEERFRLDAVGVYDRAAGPASVLADPLAFDVAWVLDDEPPAPGGASAFSDLPTVGPSGRGGSAAAPPWSTAWEHARWRDLLRARGIPRLEAYAPAAGALPGRFDTGLPLPVPFAGDLVAEGGVAPAIGEWTAVVLNQRRGAFRPASADDPSDPRFGVLSTWLPGRVELELVRAGGSDGRARGESGGAGGGGAETPLAAATVWWWRARPQAGLPEGVAGVAEGRAPDGTGTADGAGRVALAGDLLGRSGPAGDRSPWLLVEVEAGGERRCATLSALDLSLAYARGAKYVAPVRLVWERLAVPGR